MLGVCLKYEQTNYGSKLQAVATVQMLKDLGLNYEILRYNKRTVRFISKYLLRCFNIVFLNDRYDQFQRKFELSRHPEIKRNVHLRNDIFRCFDEYFEENLSEFYKSYEELKKMCPQRYDILLTCSDQLWSPSALGSGFYNLMFAPDDMLKVSWASSFGVGQIPWYQRRRTKRYLERIEHISMRENRGAEIVHELTGRKVPVLMDPVFVYDKAEWEKLIPVAAPEWDDYIFCYFLGDNPEHRVAVGMLAQETGKKIVTLRHLDRYVAEDENFGDFAPYDVDPIRFLNILRNASMVCTDSFHGAAFSIINEKQFVVFNRYADQDANSKNSRIDSLCANVKLENRRYSGDGDILNVMNQAIDYTEVNSILVGFRNRTKKYLEAAIVEQTDNK